MKNPLLYLLTSGILLLTVSCGENEAPLPSCTGVQFEYEGSDGPDYWSTLCVDYTPCGGKVQSPINITGALDDASLMGIPQTYISTATHIVNKGHTIQFNVDAGSSILINGEKFDLLQFHTHTLSEHELNGIHHPMEMHFVHKNLITGNLAVIGVFVEEGAENPILKNFVDHLPVTKDATYEDPITFSALDFMPSDKSYFTYSGSLTTPPCSEIVTWFVMEHHIEASAAQIHDFEALEHANNRPVQAIESRMIKHFKM
jgi:carbonic anhydrase